MPFTAIVHAPRLRTGARVNIAEADQDRDQAPSRIDRGAELRVRFGVCCPDLARGTIVACLQEPENAPQSTILAVNGERWLLVKGIGGVSTPGLISEDWFVTEAAPRP